MRPSPAIRRRLTAIGDMGDDEMGLTEAVLTVAAAERPGVDTAPYERHLEKLTDEVSAYAGKDADDPKRGLAMRAEALVQVLARRYGYGGADDAYEDWECANLMRVIDRRQGLPVLLGIIYLHVARALGWDAGGLDFPPRFLIRLQFAGGRLILDPFDGGLILEPRDLRDLYKAVSGSHVELRPDHTRAMSNRAVALRSRRNVKILHLRADRLEDALDEIEMLLLMAPGEAPLWREAGILNARLDRLGEAVAALEEFLRHADGEGARYRTSILLQELRSRLN